MVRLCQGPYRYTTAVLRDGGCVFVRPVCPKDVDSLASYFRMLGPTTASRRFHGFQRKLSTRELQPMTDPKFPSHVGLLATLCGRGGLEDQIVAEGLYVADCVSGVAELDLSVADQHQRRGIGSLLLETLVGWARCARLVRIDAEVLASNHDALQFLVSRGFRYDGCPSGGVCRVFLPIEEAKRACSEPAITSDSF